MTQSDLILLLSVACGALAFLSVTWFFTVEQHYARAVEARLLAHQNAASAHAQTLRAERYKAAQEQAINRANLLAVHVSELEEEKARLEQRVLYQSSLLRQMNIEDIRRLAVMDAPLKWLPADANADYTINLN